MNIRSIGTIAVSAIVIMTFGATLLLILTKSVPESATRLADVMMGALTTAFVGVVQYWVGSSSGSAVKTELLAQAPPVVIDNK